MPEASDQQVKQIEIEGLGYRGEGYTRTSDNRFISVWHVLPGDRVSVRLGPFERRRAWGEIIEWHRRAPEHVDPLCRYYDRCTGCQLRHMSPLAERRFKLDAARRILQRFGPKGAERCPIDWLDNETRIGFRVRGRFQVEVAEDRVNIGLRSTKLDRRIVDIRDCPVQHPAYRQLMGRIGDVLDAFPELAREVSAIDLWTPSSRLGETDGQPTPPALGMIQLRGSLCSRMRSLLAARFEAEEVSLGLVHPHKETEMLWGETGLTITHLVALPSNLNRVLKTGDSNSRSSSHNKDDTTVTASVVVPWGSWYHPNPSAAHMLAKWVLTRLLREPHQFALDLCCGIGTLTFSLAPHLDRLIAVDEDYQAVDALARATKSAGFNHIEVRAGRIGKVLRKLRSQTTKGFRPTAAVINPMRKPLGSNQLADLAPLGVNHILYLGPSAVSTARDACVLNQVGYRLIQSAVINLHPTTSQQMLALEFMR